jgi:hypothetical protein
MKIEERHTLIVLQFLLSLALRTREEPVDTDRVSAYYYILHRRYELFWMKDFLMTKLDSTNETIPKVFDDKELLEAEEIIRRNPPFTTTNVVTNRQLYVVLSKLTTISPNTDVPIFWKKQESDYKEKIESIQSDIEKVLSQNQNYKNKLQQIQTYFRTNCPDVKPPDADEEQSGGWKLGKHGPVTSTVKGLGAQRSHKDAVTSNNFEHQEHIVQGIATSQQPPTPSAVTTLISNSVTHGGEVVREQEMIEGPFQGPKLPSQNTVLSPVERDPDYADSKVKELREIFSDTFSEDVLKSTLRSCNWSIERAVEDLFEENNKSTNQNPQ